MKKCVIRVLCFISLSPLAIANTPGQNWVKLNTDSLHTTTIYSKEDTRIVEGTLFIGFGSASNCYNKEVGGTISFPAYKTGFSLGFTKDSVRFDLNNPYTCVEEHYKSEGETVIIAYNLINNGKEFTEANPNKNDITFP